jgi:hypothetical protein
MACSHERDWSHRHEIDEVQLKFSQISGSHGGKYEDGCLVSCSAMLTCRSLPTFRMYLLLPSSILTGLVMETASTSRTQVNFYQSTRRNNPDDSHLQIKVQFSGFE